MDKDTRELITVRANTCIMLKEELRKDLELLKRLSSQGDSEATDLCRIVLKAID